MQACLPTDSAVSMFASPSSSWCRSIACIASLCLFTAPVSAEKLRSHYSVWTLTFIKDVAGCLNEQTSDYAQYDVFVTKWGLRFSIKKDDHPAAIIEIVDHLDRREVEVTTLDNAFYRDVRQIALSCL